MYEKSTITTPSDCNCLCRQNNFCNAWSVHPLQKKDAFPIFWAMLQHETDLKTKQRPQPAACSLRTCVFICVLAYLSAYARHSCSSLAFFCFGWTAKFANVWKMKKSQNFWFFRIVNLYEKKIREKCRPEKNLQTIQKKVSAMAPNSKDNQHPHYCLLFRCHIKTQIWICLLLFHTVENHYSYHFEAILCNF